MVASSMDGSRRVLLVVCGEPEPEVQRLHGDFVAWFRRGLDATVGLDLVDPRVQPLPASLLDGVMAVLVTGSAHGAYEPLPWIAPLEALLRTAVARPRPVLGVCFGHQVLAQALGGEVVRNPRGREIGTVAIDLVDDGPRDPLFRDFPHRFHAHVTHGDTVRRPPPGARVLATSAVDGCQAFRVGTAWGVQFHPEFQADELRAYVGARAAQLRREGLDPDAILAAVRDTVEGALVLPRFLALAGTPPPGASVTPWRTA
jgi:GMP synthase (glutamine-hydrolysing)